MSDGGSSSRLRLHVPAAEVRSAAFAEDVRAGLSAEHKHLPCRHLYDAEGSRLFEAICRLPEYYVTRAEREILEKEAHSMVRHDPAFETVVELGSGSARKTRLLLDACLARRSRLRYVPIDISRSALEESARWLLDDAHPGLEVHGVADTYEGGLALLPSLARRPLLVLWLGSNVGNFSRAEARRFLAGVRRRLAPNDRLLMGIDLRKERHVLEQAYDDDAGVTQRFNLNLLARVNRELGGRFDLDAFEHRAVYHEDEGRVELSLVSRRPQRVRIDSLDLDVAFERGEPIHTEDSYKYDFDEISALARGAGLRLESRWVDAARRFSVVRLAPVSPAGGDGPPVTGD